MFHSGAHCQVKLPIRNMSLREDLKHEAYVCQVCAPIAY